MITKRNWYYIDILLFLLFIVVTLIFNLSPKADLPSQVFILSGSWLHFFNYVVLSALLVKLSKHKNNFQLKSRLVNLLIFLTAFLFSLGIEFVQLSVPGRSFEYKDLLFNSIGILTGLLLSNLYFIKKVKQRKNER